MHEKELIKRFKAGDENAFQKIFNLYRNSVFSICYRFTRDRHESEDLCQDIFLKIYKSLYNFHAKSKLSTWIYRIAVNQSLNHLRNKKKTGRTITIHSDNQDAIEKKFLNYTLSPEQPDIDLEEKQKGEIVWNAVQALPKNQRTAIILQKYEGFSCKEIAKILDCTLLSVQSRLYRGKKNLYKKLLPYLGKI